QQRGARRAGLLGAEGPRRGPRRRGRGAPPPRRPRLRPRHGRPRRRPRRAPDLRGPRPARPAQGRPLRLPDGRPAAPLPRTDLLRARRRLVAGPLARAAGAAGGRDPLGRVDRLRVTVLLGKRPEDSLADPELIRLFLACHADDERPWGAEDAFFRAG